MSASSKLQNEIDRLLGEKQALLSYINSKLQAEDYHAVQDACSDIREIEAALKIILDYKENF